MDLPAAHHIMETVRIHTRSIYHIPCFVITGICLEKETAFQLLNRINFCIKPKFHAVSTGIFSHCDIQSKRTNDSGRRCI